MISEVPRPFIFIHIPKTAGTSVELALLPVVAGVPHWGMLSVELQKKMHIPDSGLQHVRLSHFAQRNDLTQYFVWSIVRNPFERAISQCIYLSSKSNKFVAASPEEKEIWETNIRNLCDEDGWVAAQDLGATQFDYLSIDGTLAVDRCVRFEELKSGWRGICADLGIEELSLPHAMRSNRNAHYSDYYNDRMIDAVSMRFRDDLEAFDYDF